MVTQMPQLQHSPILKYVINTNKGRRVQLSLPADDGTIAEIGECSKVDFNQI